MKDDAPKPVSDSYYYPQVKKQTRRKLVTETYEYDAPFKYDNIRVIRHDMMSREMHGVEMNMVNDYHKEGASESTGQPGDRIILEEENPIVRLVVMGSACTPPGYIAIECEPITEWRNEFEYPEGLPARFRIDNLWGMHLRIDALLGDTLDVIPKYAVDGDFTFPPFSKGHGEWYKSMKDKLNSIKTHYRENPLAGMSSAIFEIPPSKKVTIQGGSQIPGWVSDNFPNDHHYSFRTIRSSTLVSS